jgi:hypothetical protein
MRLLLFISLKILTQNTQTASRGHDLAHSFKHCLILVMVAKNRNLGNKKSGSLISAEARNPSAGIRQ